MEAWRYLPSVAQDHHDEDDDLQDADKLEIVEKELFAISFAEVTGEFCHEAAPPWGSFSKYKR